MNRRIEELGARDPVVTDGAWGTRLQEQGLAPGACPDRWNLERPEAVRAVAAAYAEAGSRALLTNTFGANRLVLERHGLADRAAQINRLGAELSREGGGDGVFVFGSIGPSGRMLLLGDTTPGELESVFGEQARALRDGGVDAIVLETQSDAQEARIAAEAALATGLPVIASFAFDPGPGGPRTLMGLSAAEAAAAMAPLGLHALGANCGGGPEGYPEICRALRAAASLPLWVKPNAGRPRFVEGRTEYDLSPEAFAEGTAALAGEGAVFLGGCCGSTPAMIRALARRLREGPR